jgi:hypothetical protein
MWPDRDTLARGLGEVLNCPALDVVNRRPNQYSSTFPSEIVDCVLDRGERREVLCKYSGGIRCTTLSHSSGVEYEVDVYRHVLQPSGVATVVFYGSYQDPQTGWTWLVMEHLAESMILNRVPELLHEAARWIGAFHAETALMVDGERGFLRRLDDAYYREWAVRTKEHVKLAAEGMVEAGFPSEAQLEICLRRLVEADPCVVHGEYYPHNVLVRGGRVLPVDWESAAIGAGEIDLAALTEGWPPAAVRRSKEAYCQSRWPDGDGAHFEQMFVAAQVYWHLRWLGGRPSWASSPRVEWRWRELARRLAQISDARG